MPTQEQLQQLSPEERRLYTHIVGKYPHLHQNVYLTMMKKKGVAPVTGTAPPPPAAQPQVEEKSGERQIPLRLDAPMRAQAAAGQTKATMVGRGVPIEQVHTEVAEIMDAPRSATGFRSKEQFGAGTAFYAPQPLETKEQARERKATASQGAKVNQAILRNEAIKDLAEQRGATEADIRKEIANQGAAQKQVEELSEQKLQQFLSAQQQAFARAIGAAVQQEEGLTQQEKVQAIQQGTRYAYMEWMRKHYPEQYRSYTKLVGGMPDIPKDQESLFKKTLEAMLTEEKDGQLYETWAMAGLRTLGGTTRAIIEPAMQALTYEADPEGRKLDEDDFGFFATERTGATGAERAVEGETLGAQILSGIKSGRMFTDDLLQLQAVNEDALWGQAENIAFGVGLVTEMLLPVSPLTFYGGTLSRLGSKMGSTVVEGAGDFLAHPIATTAAEARIARRKNVAQQFGVDTGSLTARDVVAKEVVDEMVKDLPELVPGKPQENLQVLQDHLKKLSDDTANPEVKRALQAMSTRAAQEAGLLQDRMSLDVLQSILEEEVASTLVRAVPNDIYMPTPGVMVTAAKEAELGPVVTDELLNSWSKKNLMEGNLEGLGEAAKNANHPLWAAAKKDQTFFDPKGVKVEKEARASDPKNWLLGDDELFDTAQVVVKQGIVDKLVRGEELTSLEADSLRIYIKEQLYLNPKLMEADIEGAAKALGRETPTMYQRERLETPLNRRMTLARDAQDLALAAMVPLTKAAKKLLPEAVNRAEKYFLKRIKTEGIASQVSQELSRIQGLMTAIPKRFKDDLKSEFKRTKDVVTAYENVIAQGMSATPRFYENFLETFFRARAGKEKGAVLIDDTAIKRIIKSMPEEFATESPTMRKLQLLIQEARKDPALAGRGLKRGLFWKEDAILEASAVAAIKERANALSRQELRKMQKQYPEYFTKLLKGAPPDISNLTGSLKTFFNNVNFKGDPPPLPPGFSPDELTRRMQRVEAVGLNSDQVVDDIVGGILDYSIKRYDGQGKKNIFESSLRYLIENGNVDSNAISDILFQGAFYRTLYKGDEAVGMRPKYRDVWRSFDITVDPKYENVASMFKTAVRNLDEAHISGKILSDDLEDASKAAGITSESILKEMDRLGLPPLDKARVDAVRDAVGYRTGLYEYKNIIQRLKELNLSNQAYAAEALLAFEYIEKKLAAYELYRPLFRTVVNDITGNIAADLSAQIIGILNKAGFRTGVGEVPNMRTVANVIEMDSDIFTFGTPELKTVIEGLQGQAIDGTLSRGLEWLQRNNKEGWAHTWATVWGLVDMAKRSAMSGMLGGFGPLPVTRFHFLNFLSFPFIQAVTTPRMVFPTLQAFFGRGVIRRTLADEFEFGQAMNRWVTSTADEIVVRTPDGGTYTAGELRRIIDESALTRSGLSFEFSTADLAEIRRVARLTSRGDPQTGPLSVIDRMFNPVNKSVWTRLAFAMDGAYREAALIAALSQGRSLDESINVARNALLDYGGVSKGELQTMSRYMYFYTFWRMNATETLGALLRSPEDALKNIRRMAVLSREIKKRNETLDIEPPFGLDRLWSTRGKDYDRTPSIYAGMSVPALSAVMQLAPAFNFIMGSLEGKPLKAAQQEFNDFSGWLYQRPDAEFLFKVVQSFIKGDFFRDSEPASYVPARLVLKLKALGLWDTFVEGFGVAPVSNPRRMIPGKETVDGQQWRFTSKSGYSAYLGLNLMVTYAGINRAVEESLFAAQMDGRIPFTDIGTHNAPYSLEDVNLKRYKDGNFWLYLTALETPLQGVDRVQQEIKKAEAQIYLLRSLAKPD